MGETLAGVALLSLPSQALAEDTSMRATNIVMQQCGSIYQAGLESGGIISTIEHGIKNECKYVLAHFLDGKITLALNPKKFVCEGDAQVDSDRRCTLTLPEKKSLPPAVQEGLDKYIELDYQPNHPLIKIGQRVGTVDPHSFDMSWGGYRVIGYTIAAISTHQILLTPDYNWGVQTGDICKGFSGSSFVLLEENGGIIKNTKGQAISIGQQQNIQSRKINNKLIDFYPDDKGRECSTIASINRHAPPADATTTPSRN